MAKTDTNQTGLKSFRQKINLNHDSYMHLYVEYRACLFVTQSLAWKFPREKSVKEVQIRGVMIDMPFDLITVLIIAVFQIQIF